MMTKVFAMPEKVLREARAPPPQKRVRWHKAKTLHRCKGTRLLQCAPENMFADHPSPGHRVSESGSPGTMRKPVGGGTITVRLCEVPVGEGPLDVIWATQKRTHKTRAVCWFGQTTFSLTMTFHDVL